MKEAYWQAEQGRFNSFCLGRPAEEVPRIAPSICGGSFFAHHLAAVKALDDLYGVEPTPAARLIRELALNASHIEDYVRPLFFSDASLKAIEVRRRNRKVINYFFGRASHPEGGLPGGVSRGVTEQDRGFIREAAVFSLEFIRSEIERFKNGLLADKSRLDKLRNDPFGMKSYTMAQVDQENRATFYDGRIRVIDPDGKEYTKFPAGDYEKFVAEWIDPRTGARFTYLEPLGWQGLAEGGKASPLYLVDPLARLRAADGMQTPFAQKEAVFLFDTLGKKPAHDALTIQWARLIGVLQAAEGNVLIAESPQLTSRDLRNMNLKLKNRGIGAVEAPYGILIHHYETDQDGILTKAAIIAPAGNNAVPISISLKRAAQEFVKGQEVGEEFLDRVETAFRTYAPSLSSSVCSPGKMPIHVQIRNSKGDIIREIRRG